MSNGKFKMKYGDSISPGTFRADAPAQKFAPKEKLSSAHHILKNQPGYNPRTGKVMIGGSGALGIIGGVAGKAVKLLNIANIRSTIKQYLGKGAKPAATTVTKPKTFDYSKDFGKSYAETKKLGYGKPGYKWYGPPPTPKPSQSPSARLWRKHQQRVSDFNK